MSSKEAGPTKRRLWLLRWHMPVLVHVSSARTHTSHVDRETELCPKNVFFFFFFKSWTGDSLFPNHGVFLEMGVLPFPFLLLIAPRRSEVLFVFYRKGTRAFHVNQCVIRWLKFACLLREILLKLSVLTCRTVFSTYFG